MVELSLLCQQGQVEWLADLLESLDAQSVAVEDADALTDAEQALFGEPGMVPEHIGWQHSRVLALFASQHAAQSAEVALREHAQFSGCAVVGIAVVPEQDWVRLTQSQFSPVQITPEFWIVPTWHDLPALARQVIRLDPGLAFGTGTHPTTSMCLRWIATTGTMAGGLGRVLDYGCGSGILGIAAAKFGAQTIDAVDIDPAAVESARLNAAANGVVLRCGLPDQVSGLYQTVLANILASPLKVLAPLLCERLAPGGHLVLAGILDRQADELEETYAPFVRLKRSASQDGWTLMTATR
jgi:ribosomal protein L11 methyltransferase